MASNTNPAASKLYTLGNELQLMKVKPMTSEAITNVLTIDSSGIVRAIGVDSVPKAGSKKLLLSGAVYNITYNIDGSPAVPQFTAVLSGIVPASGGGTTNFMRADGVWAIPPVSGLATLSSSHIFIGNVSNIAVDVAMTGDVTITNAGVTTIGAGKVGVSKMTMGPLRLLGRTTAGAGAAEELQAGNGLSLSAGFLDWGGTLTNNVALNGPYQVNMGVTTPLSAHQVWTTGGGFLGINGMSLTIISTNVNISAGSSFNIDGAIAVGYGQTTQVTSYRIKSTTIRFLPNVAPVVGQVPVATAVDGTWTWQTVGGTGTVTTVSVVTANGFAGTVATATTTPAITLTTTITGILKGNGTSISAASAGSDYLVNNQTITLSGDVSGSGATAITTTIGANKVTLAMMATIATASFLGRITAGTGNVEVLTGTQATTLLDNFTSTLKGLVPLSGGGTVNFLRADGTWTTPAGGGTVTSVSVVTANGFAGTVATATTTPAITLTTTITGILKGNGTSISAASAGSDYLVNNQTITLSGDVAGSGATAITTTIGANKVTLAMMATVSTARFLGRVTAATGNVESLTGTQATTLLDVFTSTLQGLVPSSGGGTTNFLRADGTWAIPAAGPMTTLGDMIYENATPTPARFAGNITTANLILRQTGTGAVSAAPSWSTLVDPDAQGLFTFGTSGSLAVVLGSFDNTSTTTIRGNPIYFQQPNLSSSNTFLSFTQGNHSGTPMTVVGLVYNGGTIDAAAVGVETIDINWNLNRIVKITPSTTIPVQRAFLVQAVTYASTSAMTITDAATVAVSGGAIKGANMIVTNTHALLIQAGAVGACLNSFGMTVNAQSGATNNYTAQFIGGTTVFSATVSGYASINLPHGTAPSAPINGDFWTTTVNAYARINGVTVVLGGGGGGSVVYALNPQAAGYTFVMGDATTQTLVQSGSASTSSFTVPTNASVSYALGSVLNLVWDGTGQPSWLAAGGVTLNSSSGSLAVPSRYAVSAAVKVATNTWYVWNGLQSLSNTAANQELMKSDGFNAIPSGIFSTATGTFFGASTIATALVHLKGGTAAVGGAPLKFSTGINTLVPEFGAMEWDGTTLSFTRITKRESILTSGMFGPVATGSMSVMMINNASGAVGSTSVDDLLSEVKDLIALLIWNDATIGLPIQSQKLLDHLSARINSITL